MQTHHHLEILLIACGNEDGFHADKDYFLSAIVVVGEQMILTPSREQAEEIFQQYPDNPILMLVTPCKACLAKGIRSTPYFQTFDRGYDDDE